MYKTRHRAEENNMQRNFIFSSHPRISISANKEEAFDSFCVVSSSLKRIHFVLKVVNGDWFLGEQTKKEYLQ